MAQILAIDVGERKIGLAIGDTETKLAFPRRPLLVESWTSAWQALADLVRDEQVATIVIGWPRNSDGSEGAQARRVEQFIELLMPHVQVPIVKRDERLTSQAVQREQATVGRTLARGEEDSRAAQLLLESYLVERP